jgi:integrase
MTYDDIGMKKEGLFPFSNIGGYRFEGDPELMAVRRFGKGFQADFYAYSKRVRKVFPHRRDAQAYEGRIKASIREDRYLDLKREIFLKQLSDWYLSLEDVKRKISFERDRRSIQKLNNFFGTQSVRHLSASVITEYQAKRMGEMSYRKKPTRPATVNREVSCLRAIFNKAILDGKLERNPTRGVKLLREKNERERVLSFHEWEKYKSKCPRWYLPIAITAYRTAMRKSEIVTLLRSRVDLKGGFIRLKAEDTKTGVGRTIPIHPELMEVLKKTFKVRPLNCDHVFHRNGKPLGSNNLRWVHEVVCEKAEIEDFTFHDFRHTCINRWRREGHDYFKIMAASGHKTMSVFKRYNMVCEEELKTLVKFASSHFRN